MEPSGKVYHYAAMVNKRGGVSPACSDDPKALNLKKELWTIQWEAVTCKKCLARKPSEGQAEG